MKKISLLALLFVGLLVISGCTVNGQPENKQDQLSEEQSANKNQQPNWDENFEEVSFDDLKIGQKVLVMGVQNDDSSITAEHIIMGSDEINFDEIVPMRIRTQAGEMNQERNQNFQPPEGMTDFQNMSDEERVKFREQMIAQRGGERPDGASSFQGRGSSQAEMRLTGEIIIKDNESITIKLDAGGSGLVFLSNSTVIFRVK